jgi:hypothetical protein
MYSTLNHPEQDGHGGGQSVNLQKVRKHGLFLSPAPGNHLALNVQDNYERLKILVRETAQTHLSNAEGKNESKIYFHFIIHFL